MSYTPPIRKTILDMTADELAERIEVQPDIDYIVSFFKNIFPIELCAKILNSVRLNIDKAVSILNNANLSIDRIMSILNSAYISADRVQAILYRMAELKYFDRLIDILTYGASDVTLSANATYTGVNRFRTLDLNGYTYTADGQPHVIIAYSIVGGGSIVKTPTGGAGGAPGLGDGRGGNGGGGLIILARDVNVSTITADGENGDAGGIVSVPDTYEDGSSGGSGLMIVVGTDTPGNGGDGGGEEKGVGGAPGAGGGGGTLAGGHRGGDGGNISLTTYSASYDLAMDVVKSLIDWWIVNVLGKTPTSTKPIPNIYGAGGGGGADEYTWGDCGGGGGSGGQVIIIAVDITVSTISAKGGNGGNGGNEGSWDSSGGGGGGGIVYVFYTNNASVATIDVSGGASGTGDYNGVAGTAGAYRVEAI